MYMDAEETVCSSLVSTLVQSPTYYLRLHKRSLGKEAQLMGPRTTVSCTHKLYNGIYYNMHTCTFYSVVAYSLQS